MANLSFIDEELKGLKDAGLFVNIRTIGSPQDAWTVVDGRRCINMCSNNYLGFANHPQLRESAQRAIEQWGVGPAAVRTICGTMDIHLELERKLSAFKGAEATISYQSGFSANISAIPALVGKEDAIYSDELNHASIIDGARLSRARVIRYSHSDTDHLEHQLRQTRGDFRRALVVTDGVFSMDGDIAPLDKVVAAAQKYDAISMVDDANGEGVMGRDGRGIADHFNLHGEIDLEIGTLSKAFGVMGGYAAGRGKIVEYLRQKSRPFLFSSAATPADVAACISAVDILSESGELVGKLWENAEYFRAGMKELGFDTGHSETPIVPVMLGEAQVAQEFSRRLYDEGVFAMAIGFPTVPRGKARIRVMNSAAHSKEDLDTALSAFEKVGNELSVVG